MRKAPNRRLRAVTRACLTMALIAACNGDSGNSLGIEEQLTIQPASTASGDRQAAIVGTTLPLPLRVLVQRGANPAPGVAVYWQASRGHVSADSTKTDGSGIASVLWTLDTLAGGQTVEAVLSAQPGSPDTVGSRVSFTALADPGPPIQLGFSVPPSNTFAGRPLVVAVRVAALDRFGNVATDFVGNVTVAIGSGPSGGTLSGTTRVAAVAGVATFAGLSIAPVGVGYTLTASATGLTGATSSAFDVVAPGQGRIAFTSDRGGCPNIYAINADGSGVVEVNSFARTDGYCGESANGAAWSPDGTRIAYYVTPNVYWAYSGIQVMNADGSPLAFTRGLTDPAWSPDRARIAAAGVPVCSRGGCGNVGIMLMNTDGSGLVGLTYERSFDFEPAWSPDGRRIAFTRRDDIGEIFVMNADGSGLTNLTNNPATDDGPAWSPDGTKFAFRSNRTGVYDLYIMNADGSGVSALTADTATEGRPAWSPDGTKIAFASTRDGNWEIYVMNADGSGVTRLTDNLAFDARPAWAP